MKRLLLFILCLLSLTAYSANWYVAVNGLPTNSGTTTNSPVDIYTAIGSRFPAQPGDTIWLMGGQYASTNGLEIFLSSTTNAPIIYRNYNNQSVEITTTNIAASSNGVVTVGANATIGTYYYSTNIWLWGLEIDNSNPMRYSTVTPYTDNNRGDGVSAYGPMTKVINCLVHDAGDGISLWSSAIGSEAYGNIIFNNGFTGPAGGQGHGFYLQNDASSLYFSIAQNMCWNDFGGVCQVYGHLGPLANMGFTNNVFNGWMNVGGASPCQNINFYNNWFYGPYPDSYNGYEMGWQQLNTSMAFVGNYFQNYTPWFWFITNFTFTANSVYTTAPANGAQADSFNINWWRPDLGLNPHGQPYTIPFNQLVYNVNSNTYAGQYLFETNEISAACFPTLQLNPSLTLDMSQWTALGWDLNSIFITNIPPTNIITVLSNKYEPGRGEIIVCNWAYSNAVNVNLSQVLTNGSPYQVFNCQDIKSSPVCAGVYNGGTVKIPMTDTNLTPMLGWTNMQPSTLPQFGYFLIEPLLGGQGMTITGNARVYGDEIIPGH